MPELPLSTWSDGASINNIFNFSRQLVNTNRLDVLLESIARHATEILQVRFSRIITLEADGSLAIQAFYIDPALPLKTRERLRSLPATPKIYRQAITSKTPLLVRRDDSLPIYWSRQELGLDVVDSVCLLPMRVENDEVGVLVLGDRWTFNHDPFEDSRLRLATLIAEQAAGAIYRVRQSNRLKEIQLEVIMALAQTIEKRHGETSKHCEHMAELAEMTAMRIRCSQEEIRSINYAARLHDIGKIAWPDEMLEKTAPLTDAEWELVKMHPQKGAEIVLMISNLEHVAFIILAHHEHFDGGGYPHGLQKTRIPLGARILAVVDAYVTMIDGRPYRPACTHAEAMAELRRCTGTSFDPQVVSAFSELFT